MGSRTYTPSSEDHGHYEKNPDGSDYWVPDPAGSPNPTDSIPAPTAPAYSQENADQQAAYDAKQRLDAQRGGSNMEHYDDNFARAYHGPGAATWGGSTDQANALHDYAQGQVGANDAAQAANTAAMQRSAAGIYGTNANVSTENAGLSARDANARAQQMNLLSLDRAAASGLAPSAAAGQTRLGMDTTLGSVAGGVGGARGLAALGGAQTGGAQGAGSAGPAAGYAGAQGRATEIANAMGMYGSQAGTVRDQDLSRLGLNSKNSMANAVQSDGLRVGSAQLLAGQAGLGNGQSAVDLGWQDLANHPADQQLQNDQEMAAIQAGASADEIAAIRAKRNEQANNTRNLVNGGVNAGLTAVGTYFGGPVGGAAGSAAGQGIAAGTSDWWK